MAAKAACEATSRGDQEEVALRASEESVEHEATAATAAVKGTKGRSKKGNTSMYFGSDKDMVAESSDDNDNDNNDDNDNDKSA